jgi:hypothetical protein
LHNPPKFDSIPEFLIPGFVLAPLELQIQYAINMETGSILVKEGFLISICGGIARLLFKLVLKKRQKK